MELVLGTANFHNQYGGVVLSPRMVEEIITEARKYGIKHYETAVSYNCSKLLNKFLKKDEVLTYKIKDNEQIDPTSRNIETLMLHSTKDMDAIEYLRGWRKWGIIKNIGVSVYDPEELEGYIRDYQVIQVPVNLVNQRWSHYIGHYKNKKKTIQARSIFLQGELLNSHGRFADVVKGLENPLKACIDYVRTLGVDQVVVGVKSPKEIKEISACFNSPIKELNWKQFERKGDSIDPRKW